MASNHNDFSIPSDNKLDDQDEDENEDDIVTERQNALAISGSSNFQINFLGDSNIGQPKDRLAVEQCKSYYQLTVDEVKKRLIQILKDLKLPITPWLGNEKHKLLIKDYFVQLELRGTNEIIIPLNEIFIKKETTEEIKKIYIEAPPGFGKTTFTYKLATDWVSNEKYIKKFKLAFLVVLKYLRGKSVKTMLSEIVEHEDEDELWELINNEKTLIILDGLDEIGDKDKCKINDIQFRGTIVITGRTGSYNLDSRDTIEYFHGLEKNNELRGRFITISGIGRKNRVDFLYKIFHNSKNWKIIKKKIVKLTNSNDDKFKSSLIMSREEKLNFLYKYLNDKEYWKIKTDKLTNWLNEMFKSPLMLILLAYVLNEKPGLNIEKKTDLYKNLINILIIRSQTKMNKNNESDFDLFSDEKAPGDEMVEIFNKFGSTALKNLKHDNLQFEPDGIVEKIYQMGFLLKHQSMAKFKPQVHFEGLHLSIIEFAAAISFWLYHKKNAKFTDDQLIYIRNLIVNKKKSSLIVPFLCGLMGKNVKELFIELRPHYGFFIYKDISFLLQECEMDDLLGEAISPFISNCLHLYNEPSSETLQLIEYGVKYQKLKYIDTYFNLLEYFPTNLDGVTLYVCCNSRSDFVRAIKKLKCKKLIFVFCNNFDESDPVQKIILETFNNIDCETKTFNIQCDLKVLLNLLQRKETKITRIDELHFFLSFVDDENVLSSFEQIFSFFIKHCQVKSVECSYCSYPLSNIINSMSKSPFLKSVCIVEIENNTDYKLIENLFQNINFNRFSRRKVFSPEYISTSQLTQYNINKMYESLLHTNNEQQWCNECKLTFDPNTLNSISSFKTDVLKSTIGLDKVIEFRLTYEKDIFWKTIKSCKHVRTITLSFDTTQKLDEFLKELQNLDQILFSKLNLEIETSLEFFENSLWANKFVSEMLKIRVVKTLALESLCPRNNFMTIDMVSTLKYHSLFPYLQTLICSGAVDTVLIYIRASVPYLPVYINSMFSNFDATKLQCECKEISCHSLLFKITRKIDSNTIKDFGRGISNIVTFLIFLGVTITVAILFQIFEF